MQIFRLEAYEQNRGFGFRIEFLVLRQVNEPLRNDLESTTDGDVGCLDGSAGRILRQSQALLPHRVFEFRVGVDIHRSQSTEKRNRGQWESHQGGNQSTSYERSATKAGFFVRFFENLDCAGARCRRSSDRVTFVHALFVRHHGLSPVHGSNSNRKQRERDAQPNK